MTSTADLRRPLELTLPIKVVSEANMREHHMAKANRAARQREDVGLVIKPHAYRLRGMFPLLVTLTRVGAGTLDDDNLQGAFKAVRDSVTKAVGLKSDADPSISFRYAQKKCKPGKFGIEIRIETRTITLAERIAKAIEEADETSAPGGTITTNMRRVRTARVKVDGGEVVIEIPVNKP